MQGFLKMITIFAYMKMDGHCLGNNMLKVDFGHSLGFFT